MFFKNFQIKINKIIDKKQIFLESLYPFNIRGDIDACMKIHFDNIDE